MGKINQKPGQVSFFQAIKDFFRGYVDFKGRTTRAGYWWAGLILFLLFFSLSFALIGRIFSLIFTAYDSYGYFDEQELFYAFADSMGLVIGLLVVSVALILPMIALAVRRYRDAGMRGRGVAVLYVLNFFGNTFNFSGRSSFFTLAVSVIGIFFFVLTVLPSDAITTTSTNSVMQFFFRQKRDPEADNDSDWVEY